MLMQNEGLKLSECVYFLQLITENYSTERCSLAWALNDFYLLLVRGELPQRYRHASRRLSQRSLGCEIVSNPVCYISVFRRPLQMGK